MRQFNIFDYYLQKNSYKLVKSENNDKSIEDGNFIYKKIDDNTLSELVYYLGGYYFTSDQLLTRSNKDIIADIFQLVDNYILKFTLYRIGYSDDALFTCKLVKEITDEQVEILKDLTSKLHNLDKEEVDLVCSLKDDVVAVDYLLGQRVEID